MGYVNYGYYKSLYGDKAIPEADFNRLAWNAGRKLDIATTGIDNVRKLAVAFPTNDYSAEAVKRCAVALIDTMHRIEQAEETARSAQGYITRDDGSLQGKVVSSVSAGNESISYSVSGGNSSSATLIDKALSDKTVQEQLYKDTIAEYLSGVADANGVNLLYMGRYPYRVEE